MSEELERMAEKLFDELEWELSSEESERLILDVLARVRNAALDEAAGVAKAEEEPATGEMPAEIIGQVLAGDTAYVETALIAAVRSTKKNIAAAIFALKEPT